MMVVSCRDRVEIGEDSYERARKACSLGSLIARWENRCIAELSIKIILIADCG